MDDDLSRFDEVATPSLLLDLSAIERNVRAVRRSFGHEVELFYSVKANNHPAVLRTVLTSCAGFDVASMAETRQALETGATPDRVAFSNPVKSPVDIVAAYRAGVRLFAFDSKAEVEKLAVLAPGSEAYVRLSVDNTGSGWPLSGKFGVTVGESVSLLEDAKRSGLVPIGLTFHVGSQCEVVENWRAALRVASDLWRRVAARGIPLSFLDLGGGLPAPYKAGIPTIDEIGAVVREELARFSPRPKRVLIEPGRFIVADAGTLVASVIGRAERGAKLFLYLDVGLFNGLMECYECFWYPLDCVRKKSSSEQGTETVTLMGPTCDSVDVIARDVAVPAGLTVGDLIVFNVAGAYTAAYARYNGFDYPSVRLVGGK